MDTENTPQGIEATPKKPGLLESKKFTAVLVSLTIIAALFLSFRVGMFVGFRQATTSYEYGASYHRVFGGPRQGFMTRSPLTPPADEFMGKDFVDTHGVFGKIIKIDNNVLVLDAKNTERTILVSDDAAVRKGREPIGISEIKINDNVVVIGSTDGQGQIQAKLIRIFP